VTQKALDDYDSFIGRYFCITRVAMNGRAAVRNAFVVLLASIGIFYSVSDIVVPWHPYGIMGFVAARDTVVFVIPKSHAAQAGLRVGDRVDFRAMSPIARVNFNGFVLFGAAGSRYTLPLIAPSGVRRSITAEVDVAPRTLADDVSDIIECLSFLVSIVLAAALVMLRPSRVTWSFFVFVFLSTGLAVTPGISGILAIAVVTPLLGFLETLSWIPLAIFALRFPHDSPGKAARILERVLLGSLVVFLPLVFVAVIGVVFAIKAPVAIQTSIVVLRSLPPFGLLLAAAMFAVGYRSAIPTDRTRMRLVIAGFLVGYSGIITHGVLVATTHDFQGTIWFNNLLSAAPVFGAIAVAYAIVRHRVLDIRIVVRRAAVYAVLTTCVVALIAIMDFFVGKVFAGTKLAAIGEIGVAVILGLALNPLHRRLEIVVDAAMFRRRRQGEARLERIAAGLLHAQSQQTISELIASEPTRAFDLTSAAIFERDETGDFRRVASESWEPDECAVLHHDSSLVLQLIAADEPLRLVPEDLAKHPDIPHGQRVPSIAVPITFRGVLDGIAFYGAHRTGEEIDDGERASLVRLCRSAASAYDHLDAEVMRVRMTLLETEVAHFRAAKVS
jgi:hypothetical protein